MAMPMVSAFDAEAYVQLGATCLSGSVRHHEEARGIGKQLASVCDRRRPARWLTTARLPEQGEREKRGSPAAVSHLEASGVGDRSKKTMTMCRAGKQG